MAVGALMPASSRASAAVPRPVGSVLLGLLVLCSLLCEGAVYDWSAVYLRDAAGAGPALAAAGYAAFSLVNFGLVAFGVLDGFAVAPPVGAARALEAEVAAQRGAEAKPLQDVVLRVSAREEPGRLVRLLRQHVPRERVLGLVRGDGELQVVAERVGAGAEPGMMRTPPGAVASGGGSVPMLSPGSTPTRPPDWSIGST